MGSLGSARVQSSIEFLTTYGFALLAIAAGIAIIFTITATTRNDASSQCSAYGSITCNLAYYYSPSGSQYSAIVLSVTNAQESAINITNTIVTISSISYVGICSPNLVLPGQEATCMAQIPQGSGQGASKSGFFAVNANFCNTPHDLLPSGCAQAATYGGTFYAYVQPSPVTVFSTIASRGNSSIQLPALAQGPQIPNTSQITGSGDWVGVQEPHAVAYAFGTSGYSPLNIFGTGVVNFPSSLDFLSGNSVSCSQGYNTTLSTSYTTIYQPSANLVYFNAYADNAIEAWYKPQGSNSWNSIYNGIYWSTVPMTAIGSNSLFLPAGLYSVAVEWANTCGPGLQAFQISYGPSQLTAVATPSSSSITQGESQNVNTIAAGGLTPYSYQWYEETPGSSSFSAVSGATSANYLFTTTGSTATGNYIFYANVVDSESPAVTAQTNNAVVKVSAQPTGTYFAIATGQSFAGGAPLVVDSLTGNVYWSTSSANIIEYYAGSKTYSTILSANLDVYAMAIDSSGNIYWSDGYGSIVAYYVSTKTSSTLAIGQGEVFGVLTDSSGNVYWTNNNAGNVIKYSGGSSSPISTSQDFPYAITADSSGNIYWTDSGSGNVMEYSAGTVTAIATGQGNMYAITADSSGNIYWTDSGSGNVMEYSAGTKTYSPIATSQADPLYIAVDSSGNVYWSDYNTGSIMEYYAGSKTYSPIATGQDYPQSVAVDSSGNVYWIDYVSGNVMEYIP